LESAVVIGLLGGVASGKSTVARLLADAGAARLDADDVARRVLDEPPVVDALVARHGASLLAAGSGPRRAIDRAALARLAFRRPEVLSHLESLVHPRVVAELTRRLRELSGVVPAIVLDVPLLLEKGELAGACDLLLFVECPAPERRRRVRTARGWDEGELARREAHQLTTEEKRRRADVVLVNDGDEARLREQTERWIATSGGFAGLARAARLARAAKAKRTDSGDGRDRS
jgi:dephospho-CoA kinase